MRYDIKPDHHIKAKRGYLVAFYIELFLTLQAGMVLFHFSSNETWEKCAGYCGRRIMPVLCRCDLLEISQARSR